MLGCVNNININIYISIWASRYEDLSLNTLETSQKLMKFLNLRWTQALSKYIRSHTRRERFGGKNQYGTVRNSKAAVVNWTKILSMSNISKIQEACKIPMRILGYSNVENSQDLANYLQSLTNLPELNV